MAAKPYSFRYPYDIQTTLEPWRSKLANPVTGYDVGFEQVIAILRDRDRAIEDYLSFGIGQGYLAQGLMTGGAFALSIGAYGDVPGMSATFTVPDGNRQIKVTSSLFVENTSAAAGTFVFTQVLEDGVGLHGEYFTHGAPGGTAAQYQHTITFFYSPAKGTHVVKTQAQTLAGVMTAVGGPFTQSFITVEDIGPASR